MNHSTLNLHIFLFHRDFLFLFTQFRFHFLRSFSFHFNIELNSQRMYRELRLKSSFPLGKKPFTRNGYHWI